MATDTVFESMTGDVDNISKKMPELHWQHPYKQGFATVAQGRSQEPVNLYYEMHGNGPRKVLFIMGLNTPCQAWDFQTSELAPTGENTIVTFDARGVGWTDGTWDSYNTTEWAKDVLELLDHLGWASEVHAVGYSAGGQVLQKMLLLSPQRFKSIALVSTTAGGTRPFTGAYTLISNLFVSDPHEQLRRLMRINYTKSWLDQRPDDDSSVDTNFERVFKKQLERNTRNRPQQIGGMVSQAIASMRHWVTASDLAKIRSFGIPTLVATNTWDNFVHTSHSFYLRDHLQPDVFMVFEDTGHVIPTAKYKEFNSALVQLWTKAETPDLINN
ncbi:hypothetical protein INT44_002313 [Umbelopsis vinacea]|uniref:AB hydrolase-1 domain-containing protein n=1 Tax=Umbelopsis vinacea TaxID=44442 RepID=A0A8H7Q574_9FUNG|nr:hypothetical protein INT44_002313 [Umbelopsis vinacea]